jgi:hypothetical protein
MRLLLSFVLMFLLVWPGLAQTVPPRDGIAPDTEVEIELLESISSETLKVGQTVPFKLVRDLQSDGITLLPAGTPFTGTVTSANAAKHWGKAGAFDLKFNPLKSQDGTLVRLDFHHPAKLNARGEKTGETIASAMVLTYYFPLIPVEMIVASRKGKPFKIRAGERYLVYVTGTEVPPAEPPQP